MPQQWNRSHGRSGRLWLVGAAMLAASQIWTQPAAALDPMLGLEIAVAKSEGGDRAEILQGAIAVEQNPAVRVDLLAELADLHRGAGRPAEAGRTELRLADEIAPLASGSTPELVAPLDRAANDFASADAADEEVAALARLLPALSAGGMTEEIERAIARLSALAAGAGPAAPAAQAEIAAFEAASEETERDFGGDAETGFHTVQIFYATDRARSGAKLAANFYGSGRGPLELGAATVSVPASHRPGKVEKPNIWTLDFRPDPTRHLVLQSLTPRDGDEFFAAMRDHARAGSTEAFVFVHGFNVTFEEAALRTAQMAYDLDFEGLPILYSWPSRGSLLSYLADSAVVDLSGRRLSGFLDDLVAKSGATRIHLIAHSMGNRALTDALELYALRNAGKPPAFDQVLFTAPDVDAGLFAAMAETMRGAARRMTLYASDRDGALAVSRRLHGDAARAGQGGPGMIRLDTMDSIDMTALGEDMLRHNYYASNTSALTDILSLFWRDAPPARRCGMVRSDSAEGTFRYAPDRCDGDALLPALALMRKGNISSFDEALALMSERARTGLADAAEATRLDSAVSSLFGSR